MSITLIVSSLFIGVFWSILTGRLFLTWYWSHQLSDLTLAILASAPSMASTIVGLTLYITRRKAFWKSNREQSMRLLLGFTGAILVVIGVFFILDLGSISSYLSSKIGSPLDRSIEAYLASYFPYFITSALWLIAGAIFMADSIRNVDPD
jgi:membrane protease YdiL (CAAX protease family)